MHHGRPTLNLSSLMSVAPLNRVSSISSPHHNFSDSTSKSKPNSWSISLSCYHFQCNTLPYSYLLLLSNYRLMMTVVTSTRICVQISSIPAGTPVALSPVAPSLFLTVCGISTPSSLLLCFCTLMLLFVGCMHVCTHARCYTCSMSSSSVSVAHLLRHCPTQRCGFLTNYDDLPSSLMSVCLP